jgi:pimeloyl-ACP methyl ester carboxylesterase
MVDPSATPAPDTDWRAGGHYTRLSDGDVYWRREGREDGEPIVLVHGATVPSWQFDSVTPLLLQAGFQTLRFDLYGHGASARPMGDYSMERFSRQVLELIDATNFPRPATFLGHSFGAAVTATVAAQRPEWVKRIVLVAPMLDFNASSNWSKLFRLPWVGELAMRSIGVPGLIRRRRRRYASTGHAHLTQRFMEQVNTPGFSRALVSMMRTAALGDQSARYAALQAIDRDIRVISAADDAIVPMKHIDRIRSLLPAHLYRSVKAEHNLLLTHPEVVVDTVRSRS